MGESTYSEMAAMALDMTDAAYKAMPRHRYSVDLTACVRSESDRSTVVLARSEREAQMRGIAKIFGRHAHWCADSGLRGYGQVGVPARGGGSNLITLRMCLTVSRDR